METDINTLLEKTAKGDQASFKLLYDRVAPKLMAFLMQMLADRHIAEDVLQETMLQTWHKSSQFDPNKAKATTWITAIARNRALDFLRKSSRYDQVIEDDYFKICQLLYTDKGDTSSKTIGTRTQHQLGSCIEELNNDPADCIRLAYINGFSFSEIAKFRENSINTVKSWVRRGLENLSECMQR